MAGDNAVPALCQNYTLHNKRTEIQIDLCVCVGGGGVQKLIYRQYVYIFFVPARRVNAR